MADQIKFERQDENTLLIRLGGSWNIGQKLPSAEAVQKQLDSVTSLSRIRFDAQDLTAWDSGLLTFLIKVIARCTQDGIKVEEDGLPQGVRRLLQLAAAVPERKGARKEAAGEAFLNRIGTSAAEFGRSTVEMLGFIGEAFLAFVKTLTGKANFRRSDLALFIQESGADALPIVTLISVLVGLILAFIGAMQLMLFGAQIYVADLVAITMVRVMGAVMAGIIMAGRTGAAFAAQIGTMQVNEEIDALRTLGISPVEFLVIPRMLALVLMMPLLCIYADLMGIVGGMLVGVGMLDIGVKQYLLQTRGALNLNHFFIGVFQAGVFGVLVALAGCLRGMQCGRSASAVGEVTTSAVVTGIISIVVATAIITVICNVLKI
jgi:phospholipid/cholesterol/gamma-HCH transport system permease protein